MSSSRLVFWKDSIWGVGAKYMIPGWAILQGLVFIRDEWFAGAAGQYHLGDLLPHWPWYEWVISWLGILLAVFMEGSYRAYKKTKDELDALKTPKIRIEHDAPKDIGPSKVTLGAISTSSTFTQCRVRLVNETAVTIPGVELFFDDFKVLTPQPDIYTLTFGGGLHPTALTPFYEHPAGVIREIVERDTAALLYGGVTSKRIEIQAYSRVPPQSVRGKEFLITLRAHGETTVPSLPKTYKFGDRDGQLFFEEYHGAIEL